MEKEKQNNLWFRNTMEHPNLDGNIEIWAKSPALYELVWCILVKTNTYDIKTMLTAEHN